MVISGKTIPLRTLSCKASSQSLPLYFSCSEPTLNDNGQHTFSFEIEMKYAYRYL